MERLAVVGLGSAGIQSLCHMLAWLPDVWHITSIHNPDVPSLGIGESTNPSFIDALQMGLDFDMYRDLEPLRATLKTGTVYTDWRENSFMNPLLSGTAAIHFDTNALKDFAIPRLKERWGDKFDVVEGNVDEIQQHEDWVDITINGHQHQFEFVIDCRGFPDTLEDYTLANNFVNRALIVDSPEVRDLKYTGHRATKNGWVFEVPLDNRTSFGYMYNKDITTREEAVKDFGYDEELIQKEYNFGSYYTNKVLNNRVALSGNRAAFFEPMFANSLWLYDNINRMIFDYLSGYRSATEINENFVVNCKQVEEMIAFHYHGGSVFDTPFWDTSKDKAQRVLDDGSNMKETITAFKEVHPEKFWDDVENPNWCWGPWALRLLDKNFEYNYFS